MKIKQKQGPRVRVTVRTTRTLARLVAAEAKRLDISENEWILRQLEKATGA